MDGNDRQQPVPGQTVGPGGVQAPSGTEQSPDAESQPGAESQPEPASDDGQAVTWTASEFIAHDKPFGWYVALGLGAAVFAGLVYLVTRDLISVTVVLVATFLFGLYAGHKPRQMEYRLDANGLSVGQKRFGYDAFRSFAVLEEGAIPSIVFMPLKRFAVPTTIYYPPEEEDKIVGVLADRLPMEQRGHDAIDRLMHRIRY
jgi:hypothetical protein